MDLVDFINSLEDRGTSGVLRALEKARVLSYDRERDCLLFKERQVSTEAFRHLLNRELGRR